METLKRLNEVFSEVFDDADINISREMTANDVEAWDSLSHVNLIIAIESEFDINFSQKQILTFKSVGDLLDCIQSKLKTDS